MVPHHHHDIVWDIALNHHTYGKHSHELLHHDEHHEHSHDEDHKEGFPLHFHFITDAEFSWINSKYNFTTTVNGNNLNYFIAQTLQFEVPFPVEIPISRYRPNSLRIGSFLKPEANSLRAPPCIA